MGAFERSLLSSDFAKGPKADKQRGSAKDSWPKAPVQASTLRLPNNFGQRPFYFSGALSPTASGRRTIDPGVGCRPGCVCLWRGAGRHTPWRPLEDVCLGSLDPAFVVPNTLVNVRLRIRWDKGSEGVYGTYFKFCFEVLPSGILPVSYLAA